MMRSFGRVFKNVKCPIIGMIHVKALPGTPKYEGNFENVIEAACHEAEIYRKRKIDAVMLENMHDVPYIQDRHLGPEVTASMTRIATEIKRILSPDRIPIGLQILACGNEQALAVAKAANLQFIRAEGFIFSHIADEGFTDANGGDLLRYRKKINAEDVLIFTDIKKKHSSHSITCDVSLLEMAEAAEFFLSDGIVLTGKATGSAASAAELDQLTTGNQINVPILIGSGVTIDNLKNYFYKSNGIIIGSYFKKNGKWSGDLCEERIGQFMEKIITMRKQLGK